MGRGACAQRLATLFAVTPTPDSPDLAPEHDGDSADNPKQGSSDTGTKRSSLREGAILVGTAVILYYVMLTFIARPYLIPSE